MGFGKAIGHPVFERLEERVLLSGLSASPLLMPPSPLHEGDTQAMQVNFAGGREYNNSNPHVRGLFRDLVGAGNINRGQDLFTGARTALNFNSDTDATNGLTLYDAQPTDVIPTLVAGNVSLSVDLIMAANTSDSPGLIALFNEGEFGKGLALVVTRTYNNQLLQLVRIGQSGLMSVKNTLASVSLKKGVAANTWYRLTMDVRVSGDAYSVTGKVFAHSNPDGPVGRQIGLTLTYSGSLAARALSGTGEVGSTHRR